MILVSLLVTLVLKLELAAVNAPEILDAIWAELDNVLVGKFGVTWLADMKSWLCHEPDIPAEVKSLLPPASNDANLVLIDELGAVNEPDIPVDVKGDENAPEILDAIWAELDRIPDWSPEPPSNDANLVLIDELGAINAPVISVAIWAELEINVLATVTSFNVTLALKDELGE